jgi:hypothetical protein
MVMTSGTKKEFYMKWNMYLIGVVALSIVFLMAGCSKPATTAIPTTVVTTSTIPTTTPPQNNRQFGQTIDWATTAAKLGVTEQQLRDALNISGGGFPDIAAAATKLGVTEQALRDAMGFTESGFPSGGVQGGARPAIDYAAAAVKLGVTEEQLRAALGDMSQGRPDFTAAANKLGVTVEALQAALGFQPGIFPGGVLTIPPSGSP